MTEVIVEDGIVCWRSLKGILDGFLFEHTPIISIIFNGILKAFFIVLMKVPLLVDFKITEIGAKNVDDSLVINAEHVEKTAFESKS